MCRVASRVNHVHRKAVQYHLYVSFLASLKLYNLLYSTVDRNQRVFRGGAASPHLCQRQALLRGRALRIERRHVRLVLNQAFDHA
jgi:hypothetical protein